jgi:hypothetical protein
MKIRPSVSPVLTLPPVVGQGCTSPIASLSSRFFRVSATTFPEDEFLQTSISPVHLP